MNCDAFIAGVGAIVMGRTRYDWVRAHLASSGEPWSYAMSTFVATHAEDRPGPVSRLPYDCGQSDPSSGSVRQPPPMRRHVAYATDSRHTVNVIERVTLIRVDDVANWHSSVEEIDRVLAEQNPWRRDGTVPRVLAPPVERALARKLWGHCPGPAHFDGELTPY